MPFSYAIRNLFRDPTRLLQTVGGATLVVLLMITAAALTQGMSEVLSASGSPRNIILLGKGSEESLERSEVHIEAESAAATGMESITEILGTPAVSGEITYQAPIRTESGAETPAILRGVLEKALLVHESVQLTEGYFPSPGQVMVGSLTYRKLDVPSSELTTGRTIKFGNTSFTISGIFTAPGTVLESEIWFNRNDLSSLTQRDSLSAVYVKLNSPENFDDAHIFSVLRNDLELTALREDDYYSKLAEFYAPIKVMTWVTVSLVAAGAIFGGLNTLYAAFASRTREMATLQSIGFTRTSLLISLLQESLIATLAGTLIALTIAALFLDGLNVPFSIGIFTITLTPYVILTGLITGTLLGTTGALPPAIRTLAPSLSKALRS